MMGTIIGAIIAERTKPRPCHRVRSRANAAATPRTVANTATNSPIWIDVRREFIHWAEEKKFSYQRRDHPWGGNWNVSPALKLIGMTTKVGPSSRAATAITQIRRPQPSRCSGAGLGMVHRLAQAGGGAGDPRHREQHQQRDDEQDAAQRAAAGEV